MLSFFVSGIPKTAGSKKAFRHRSTGKIVVVDDCKAGKTWRAVVALAGKEACPAPLMGALRLTVLFYLARPKGHFGKKGLLSSAPAWPTTKPDATKLLRALEDALTGICWRDDAQIVRQLVMKDYSETPGAQVAIEVMG